MAIAIIGAGIAGLTAAHSLRSLHKTIIFEKSRGLTGRAATRWQERPAGRIYLDHGAQYIKTDSPVLHDLMLGELPRKALDDIARPVWVFDGMGRISQGNRDQNATPKWSYRQGVATLGRLIVDAAGLTVRAPIRVGRIRLVRPNTYALFDDQGQPLGEFDQVIVATPGPQAADLIAASELPERDRLVTALGEAQYRRCLSIMLGYDHPLVVRPYYALVNTDRAHPISWIGFEHDKPGHVVSGESALIVQMGKEWSLAHYDEDRSTLIEQVAHHASALLGEDLTRFTWADAQKWKVSQPETLADPTAMNGIVPGLWFAGDYLRGGRIHLAAETGHEVAQAILTQAPAL